MDNPLFDGQGIEFHHLQRAKLSQQQAQNNREQLEANRLLREQNDLLRRQEQPCPVCPKCQSQIRDQKKPSFCSGCRKQLFWSDSAFQPFGTRAELDQHNRSQQHQKIGKLTPLITSCIARIDELTRRASLAGSFGPEDLGTELDKVQRAMNLFESMRKEHPTYSLPLSLQRLPESLTSLADSLQCKHAFASQLESITTLLKESRRIFPSTNPVSSPSIAPSVTSSPVQQSTNEAPPLFCDATQTPDYFNDPSGIGQWFARRAMRVMACIAVADRKLRLPEVSAISSAMKSLGSPLSEDQLRDAIVAACKDVSKGNVAAVLSEVCNELRPLQRSRPATFLIKHAELVSRAEGAPGDAEAAMLITLRESLGELDIDLGDGLSTDFTN